MNRKRIMAAVTAALMCFGMSACSGQEKPAETTAGTTTTTAAAATKTEAETTAQKEESKTEETTAAENSPALSGKVTVYMPSPAGLADKLAAGFQEKTGVTVETFQGTTGEILARLEAEEANPVADVVILASWSDGLSMKADGKLMSYVPQYADEIVEGWIDSDNTLFGYSASAVGVIYNTTVIPTLSADWSELADGQYKDLLAIPDPEKSGACKDFVAGFVNKYGWEAFEGMAANGMIVPGANKAALEAVTTGEVGALVAGVDYNAYSSIAKGEPLAIYYPAGGTVVNPRPAMIMNTAPNADNAKAFIDYLFSDEAQQLVAEAYLLPGRSTVKCSGRTNLEDIPQIECDWNKMMEIASESAAKINEICK
ncbi:MAG: ABC transporter substrate-binding protein [Ruminiclostridium sp.]